MHDTVESNHNYTTGPPRQHHRFYLDDGNLVIQVENAIFRIHRYFLARYSSVLRDMLETPQNDEAKDGTNEQPLVLTSDTASGWAYLLEAIYDSHSLSNSRAPSGEVLLSILPIAHKYCMEVIENSILDQLMVASTTAAYVDLMVGSQMVDSKALYELALNGLKASGRKLDLEQAKRIGVAAYHEITTAALTSADALLRGMVLERETYVKSLKEAREALVMSRAETKLAKRQLATAKADFALFRGQPLHAGCYHAN